MTKVFFNGFKNIFKYHQSFFFHRIRSWPLNLGHLKLGQCVICPILVKTVLNNKCFCFQTYMWRQCMFYVSCIKCNQAIIMWIFETMSIKKCHRFRRKMYFSLMYLILHLTLIWCNYDVFVFHGITCFTYFISITLSRISCYQFMY